MLLVPEVANIFFVFLVVTLVKSLALSFIQPFSLQDLRASRRILPWSASTDALAMARG